MLLCFSVVCGSRYGIMKREREENKVHYGKKGEGSAILPVLVYGTAKTLSIHHQQSGPQPSQSEAKHRGKEYQYYHNSTVLSGPDIAEVGPTKSHQLPAVLLILLTHPFKPTCTTVRWI